MSKFGTGSDSSEEDTSIYISGEPEIILKEGWLKKEGPGKKPW
jgi:hypothetical protein